MELLEWGINELGFDLRHFDVTYVESDCVIRWSLGAEHRHSPVGWGRVYRDFE